MSKLKSWLVLPLVLLTALISAKAEEGPRKPFLWRIEGGTKPSYVFGTIHLATKDVTTLGPNTTKAVESADALFTEIPMDVGGQMKAAMGVITSGQALSEVLPKEIFERCEAELKRINPALTLQPFERMKIWALGVSLPLLEEQFKNPGGQPLDAILYAKAEAAKKEVGGLETVESQMAVFEQFSKEDQIAMLKATLDDMAKSRKEGSAPLAELKQAYLSGDLAQLEKKFNDSSMDPKLLARFNDALLTKRNHGMAESIAAKIKAAPGKTFFFAVGAGHLIGDEGLLKLLEKQGYKLTRVTETE
jgi:uncharacterized protein YbaP (TraB family)